MKRIALALILTLLFSAVAGTQIVKKARAETIIVPDDYASIQSAIDKADDGNTVFVKKGTYEERVLEINKSILVLGEDKDKTIINFDPPVVNYTFLYHILQGYSIAITIDANDVKFSGFTITLPTDMHCLGGINANGDRIEIVSNNLGRRVNVRLNGTMAKVSGNSIPAGMNIIGDHHTVMNNLLEGGFDTQGVYNRIAGNKISDVVLNNSFSLFFNNSLAWLDLWYCDSNFISNNTMNGLHMHTPCFNNTVSKNKIIGPGIWGILVSRGSYNVFHDNLISNFMEDNGYGIALGGRHGIAENNIFYRNILTNNYFHVSANWEILGEGNIWDNGEEGNYWDNYEGPDNDGDGIGDVPYAVEGRKKNNVTRGHVSFVFGYDNYPLMFPFDIDNVDMVFPEWATVILNPQPTPSSTPEPQPDSFPTTLVLASAITVTAIGVGLLFYSRKRKG